jgi:hypothetical protein
MKLDLMVCSGMITIMSIISALVLVPVNVYGALICAFCAGVALSTFEVVGKCE